MCGGTESMVGTRNGWTLFVLVTFSFAVIKHQVCGRQLKEELVLVDLSMMAELIHSWEQKVESSHHQTTGTK